MRLKVKMKKGAGWMRDGDEKGDASLGKGKGK